MTPVDEIKFSDFLEKKFKECFDYIPTHIVERYSELIVRLKSEIIKRVESDVSFFDKEITELNEEKDKLKNKILVTESR